MFRKIDNHLGLPTDRRCSAMEQELFRIYYHKEQFFVMLYVAQAY